MKRKKRSILLACVLVFFLLCSYGVYSLFFDSCDLPTFLANAECGCLYRIEMKEKEDYKP